jgi:hypothetical protein
MRRETAFPSCPTSSRGIRTHGLAAVAAGLVEGGARLPVRSDTFSDPTRGWSRHPDACRLPGSRFSLAGFFAFIAELSAAYPDVPSSSWRRSL